MKSICCIILTFISTFLFGQNRESAIISDNDSIEIVRSGKGIEFDSLSFINKNEIFYVEDSEEKWLKVILSKFNSSGQIIGFIHSSKIQKINECSLNKKAEILNLLHAKITSNIKDSLADLETELLYYSYCELTEKYFCEAGDINILKGFFKLRVSIFQALEIPSSVVVSCFSCKPELVLKTLKSIRIGLEYLISDIISFTPDNIENYEELMIEIKALEKDN